MSWHISTIAIAINSDGIQPPLTALHTLIHIKFGIYNQYSSENASEMSTLDLWIACESKDSETTLPGAWPKNNWTIFYVRSNMLAISKHRTRHTPGRMLRCVRGAATIVPIRWIDVWICYAMCMYMSRGGLPQSTPLYVHLTCVVFRLLTHYYLPFTYEYVLIYCFENKIDRWDTFHNIVATIAVPLALDVDPPNGHSAAHMRLKW